MNERGYHFNELLWHMEAESSWGPEDIENPRGGYAVLCRYLDSILNAIQDAFSEVDTAYAAITGINPGEFKPVVAIGREVGSITPSSTHDPNTLIAQVIRYNHTENVVCLDRPKSEPLYKGEPSVTSKLLIKLVSHGELFGFISLDTRASEGFSKDLAEEMLTVQPALSRVLAESVFSMRLWDAALTFEKSGGNQTIEDLYSDVSKRTLHAFAASGVVIRIFDPISEKLPAVDFEGPNLDDHVMDFLLQEDSAGEEITRRVYDDPDHNWTVGMLHEDNSATVSGTVVSEHSKNSLRELGIKAYCVFRLQSEFDLSDQEKKIGTISFFHQHRRLFSWRDIALAKSLSQRAADLIALHQQTVRLIEASEELQQTNEELREANESVLLRSGMMTRVEVVTLLAHDLGHRSLKAKRDFRSLVKKVKSTIADGGSYHSLDGVRKTAESAIDSVMLGLHNVNQLFGSGVDGSLQEKHFNVREVVEEVFETLGDPLHRNSCDWNISIPSTLELYGNRNILLQAIFNLVINSIDAQRARKHPRKNTIHVHGSKESIRGSGDQVILKFWDEGPGINKTEFQNPKDIFLLGTSSKPEGTGRGLPISRNLLTTHFGADMDLTDPDTAHFRMRFPYRSNQ